MADTRRKPPYWDIQIPEEAVAFDVAAFDRLIASHGTVLVHYKAVPCPIGLTDAFDVHAHAAHDNCSNGLLYIEAGALTAYLSNNQGTPIFEDIGIMDGSTIQVVLPRFYDDSEKALSVQAYDRFFTKDIEIATSAGHLFEHSQTGVDKLRYPVLDIEFLMDSHGKRYHQGQDFQIVDGLIHWVGQNQPGFDAKLGKGDTCAVRYSYRAFWYVKNLLHEVRITRDINPETGEVELVRCPHSAVLQREYVFENERNDTTGGPKEARDVRSPRQRGLGPR